jgi:hypothetical protein
MSKQRLIKFTSHGYTVKRPSDENQYPDSEESLYDRTPFIYHDPSRTLYMGNPSWAHPDVESDHDLNPHLDDYAQGYIGQGGEWYPGVNFYHGYQPESLEEIKQALGEAGYNVNHDYAPPASAYNDLTAEDIWEDEDEF